MTKSAIQRAVGTRLLKFVIVLGLSMTCCLEHPMMAATASVKADALAAVVADEKAPPNARLNALKKLFEKHFKPQGTLLEVAEFFKHCRWLKKQDWEVVGGFAGQWPFDDTSIFSATPGRTLLVAARMRPKGVHELGIGMVWLGFPMGHQISDQEIGMILSGKCPERLEQVHLLDGNLETH